MNIYALGASRNIGYFASLRLLAKGARITFLLRSPAGLENDQAIRPYVESGHAIIVKGDAFVAEDVKKGWAVAQDNGALTVDLILFTVGGAPKFKLGKGFYIDPPNLVTKCLLNVISTYSTSESSPHPPKLITISSIGLTPESHRNLPLLLKPLYSLLLPAAHEDKLGSERVVAHASGKPWPISYPEPKQGIMPDGWKETLSGGGASTAWTETVILRPALLMDGDCKADTARPGKLPYRLSEKDLGNGYSVNRKDVAHFIAEVLLEDWEKWSGKSWNMAY
ncbi:hypothetical protein BXZ70DRAFT_240320 [Cristinia sonorae]|uniref:NAD(P)-binding domain-containing protein n=1 Tax=Cristinia sonorae TaxID=1940300 RepID=A0A8K0UMU9_9AGAR|nr:hypothetical protein BXZ70DRAFT_240320 [Cristinia sonorae]